MNREAEYLSAALLDRTRTIGVERGVDLVLRALYVRWLAGQHGEQGQWESLLHAYSDEECARLFADLSSRLESHSSLNFDEADAQHGTLRDVLVVLDRAFPFQAITEDERRRFAEVFDATLRHLSRLGKQSGESDTPGPVAALMAALTVREDMVVFDPVCGNGTGLLAAANARPDVTVCGTDINPRVARRAAMRLMLHGIESRQGFEGVWCADAFGHDERGFADVVIAQPPWGMSFTEMQRQAIRDLDPGSPRGELPWILLALQALRPGGRAALLLPASSLGPRHRDNHQRLLWQGAVEAIIHLPAGVFRHTDIPTALWLLREPNTLAIPRSVALIDAQTLLGPGEGRGQLTLDGDAINVLTRVIEAFRGGEPLAVPEHVARRVDLHDLDLERGIHPATYLPAPPEEKIVHPAPERRLLTSVELANLKAFSALTRVPLAPLTLIYGANSAGKSTVVQSLLLLKQSLASEFLVTQGPLINAGGFRSLVHRHAEAPISIALNYGTLPDWISPDGTPDPSLERSVAWTFRSNAAGQGAVESVAIGFGDYSVNLMRDSGEDSFGLAVDGIEEVLKAVARGGLLYPFDSKQAAAAEDQERRLRGREHNARRVVRTLKREGIEQVPIRANGLLPTADLLIAANAYGPNEPSRNLNGIYLKRLAGLAGGVSHEVTQLLEGLTWLGPLRSAPQRVYDRADTTSTPGDGRLVAIYLFDHATVVTQVNEWLKRLEVPYALDVIPVNAGKSAYLVGDLVAISLTDERTGVNVTPADVGFGISQVLPIVVELLSRRDGVIAIEQPETHLHPRLQARLADLFIDTTQDGGQGNQLIVETHSEHLMLRVQRRIREGTLDPNNVSVVYVDQGPDGDTTVKPLRLNEQGDFMDEWPQGFFDERLDELFGEF